MKRKFDHSAPAGLPTGPKYWRSLDELADTPGFREHMAREFPEGASTLEGVDRRQFMKLMAASFALGGLGLAGCRRPEKHILPYGKSVEYTIPGLPLYFATAMPLRKSAIPLLAETHAGRPTKLEGNPSYLPHGGASSLLAQASVLDLYDPERATAHTRKGDTLSTTQVNDLLASIHQTYAGNGEGLAFLADESASPTRARLVAKLKQKLPQGHLGGIRARAGRAAAGRRADSLRPQRQAALPFRHREAHPLARRRFLPLRGGIPLLHPRVLQGPPGHQGD
jgi:MoCo/4Fe-4S cofactor protein with predicted Tat translocation signal